jgi:hypothetical protein
VGAQLGFLIRDDIIRLQHQRRREQAGRHTRPTTPTAMTPSKFFSGARHA